MMRRKYIETEFYFSKKGMKLIILSIFCLISLSLISSVNAGDFYESANSSAIQNFINQNVTEDEIVLNSGNYNGNLLNLNITRNLTIRGEGQVNIIGNGGTLFNIKSANVKIINLNISGYATAINSSIGKLSINDNNISTSGESIFINGSDLGDISIENNNIVSNGKNGIYLWAPLYSIVNIIINNNNITGTSASSIYFSADSVLGNLDIGNLAKLTITNNNISGNLHGVELETVFTNNTITISNNKIELTGSRSEGILLKVWYGNNIINITNNNITSFSGSILVSMDYSDNILSITDNNVKEASYGIWISAFSLENIITISNNNIKASWSGITMYPAEIATIMIVENNISSAQYAIYVFHAYRVFSDFFLINNTLISDNIGLYFGFEQSVMRDIFVIGNTIIATNQGIVFCEHTWNSNITVTVNYNRIIAKVGLNYTNQYSWLPHMINDLGSSFDYNWWGSNIPPSVNNDNVTINNWFVIELSANDFNTTENATINMGSGSYILAYRIALYDNTTKDVTVVSTDSLPYFDANIIWVVNGDIFNTTIEDARRLHYHDIYLNKDASIQVILDNEDVYLRLIEERVNLTITKIVTVSDNPILNGQNVTYTITVYNGGPYNATDVVITDYLPDELLYLNHTNGTDGVVAEGVHYNENNTVVWNISLLEVGETLILTVTVTVNGSGNITNNVFVSVNETNEGMESVNATIRVEPVVNLTVSKIANVSNVIVGETVVYTITVSTVGLDTVAGVSVFDILPNSLQYLSSSASIGSYNPVTGLWYVGDLAPGATVVLNITARVLTVGTIVNIVEVHTVFGEFVNNSTIVSVGGADPTPNSMPNPAPNSIANSTPNSIPAPEDTNVTNKTDNNIGGHTGVATMKNTGVPAIVFIILILTVFALVLKRKREKG